MARLHALQGFKSPVSAPSLKEWAILHGYLEHGSRIFETAQGASAIANHYLKNNELGQFNSTMGNICSGITAARILTSIPGDIFSQQNFVAREIIDPHTGISRSAFRRTDKPFIYRESGHFKTQGVKNVNWISTIGNCLLDIGRPIATVSWLDTLGIIKLGQNAKNRIGGAITGVYSVALTLFAIDGIRGLWNEWDERSADIHNLLEIEKVKQKKGEKLSGAEQKRLDAHISALYDKGFWFSNGLIDLTNMIAGSVSSVPLLGAIMHFVAGSFWLIGNFYLLPNNTAHKA
ncbi:MAG: hypothetical protein K1000chlam4_01037 [Chlamydiae bacterium]|nr:hypothetical protein [Chlamydiota bacterium]